MLSVHDHDRDQAGLRYVYPVWSRRAAGLSIGINLNTNHACNWRCIYCQVPDLIRGRAPRVDLPVLANELRAFLRQVLRGDFYAREQIPEPLRVIQDIAISGNGEPSSAPGFDQVVDQIVVVMDEFRLGDKIKLRLISNGSLFSRPSVQRAIRRIAHLDGEIWFKLDRGTVTGIQRVNGVKISLAALLRRLEISSLLCSTWIQSCFFQTDRHLPDRQEVDAYLALLERVRHAEIPVQGILLYGIARPPQQPGAARLSPVPAQWLEQLAGQIRDKRFTVKVSA